MTRRAKALVRSRRSDSSFLIHRCCWLLVMASVMERRQSSPNFISLLSNQISCPRFARSALRAADEFLVGVVAVTEEDSKGANGFSREVCPC